MRNYLDKKPTVSTTRVLNERRNSTRYPLSAIAEIVESQTRTKMSARISDLSRTGCYAEMISPFPSGDLVKMRIMKNKTPFLAQAEVTNTLCGMGMGLKFTIVAPEQTELLDKWIGELSGASPKYQMPEEDDLESVAQTPGKDLFYVVNEIVVALMRKGILSDQQGKIMLKKLAN
jgi:hypothetical protein